MPQRLFPSPEAAVAFMHNESMKTVFISDFIHLKKNINPLHLFHFLTVFIV